MIHDLKTLMGSSVSATDGKIGIACNFLFDDRTWRIRYLVVELGRWVKPHEVILAIADVDQPDWTKKSLHVDLTREQVRRSPDIDARLPVCRQQEMARRDYYGRFAYWLDKGWSSASMATGAMYSPQSEEDPHLRSVWDQTGYEVWTSDGRMGLLKNFILDEVSWHIGYLDVESGNWFESRPMLIATRWVKSISWAKRRIDLLHCASDVA